MTWSPVVPLAFSGLWSLREWLVLEGSGDGVQSRWCSWWWRSGQGSSWRHNFMLWDKLSGCLNHLGCHEWQKGSPRVMSETPESQERQRQKRPAPKVQVQELLGSQVQVNQHWLVVLKQGSESLIGTEFINPRGPMWGSSRVASAWARSSVRARDGAYMHMSQQTEQVVQELQIEDPPIFCGE